MESTGHGHTRPAWCKPLCGKPLCWVEMATVSRPFYENIDIMGTSHGKPDTFNDAELGSQPLGATMTQMQGSKQLRPAPLPESASVGW